MYKMGFYFEVATLPCPSPTTTSPAALSSTPNSHHKIQVFSDPTLGVAPPSNCLSKRVSGQSNPWTRYCEGKSCDGNWVHRT